MLKIKIGLEEALVHISWLKEKLYLCSIVEKASKRRVLRGQVYRCKLGIGIGSEENKERPCVILQYNSANHTSPNTIVAPMTRTKSQLPTVAEIKEKKDDKGNVILTGSVLLGNIVCISKARIGDYITTLTKKEMQEIDNAIVI